MDLPQLPRVLHHHGIHDAEHNRSMGGRCETANGSCRGERRQIPDRPETNRSHGGVYKLPVSARGSGMTATRRTSQPTPRVLVNPTKRNS
jgi:hypothetical protein